MKKRIFTYIAIIGLFVTLMGIIVEKGSHLLTDKRGIITMDTGSPVRSGQTALDLQEESMSDQLVHNMKNPLSLLLLQIILILAVSRVFGYIFSQLGQPTVIGEILAGIFLGPSLMGIFFPEFSAFVFPKTSLSSLQFLSQLGLAFFMFIIGMELDHGKLKNKAHDAIVISHASIIIPYFLGMVLAYFIYPEFAPAAVSFLTFSLFMGIATSITAFPVLARIIKERHLTHTPIGTLAITCAAADDVTAWCILAAVIAIAKAGSMFSALVTIALALVYVLFMLKMLKPWLNKLHLKFSRAENPGKSSIALAFAVLLLSACFAEIIGIHALFGAFIAGVVMPQQTKIRQALTEKLEDISVLLLLPIFFAFTGLRTQIGLLNQSHLWMICGLVLAAAIGGKLGGTALITRFVGYSWKDAWSLGALMNTRGLMELIVLNIGYDLGILRADLFAIMVMMALVTTFMTGPCLDAINYLWKEEKVPGPVVS